MRRKLFTLAAAMSGVLCAAVCVLWVRSASVYDHLAFGRRGGRYVSVWSMARSVRVITASDWDADESLTGSSEPKSTPIAYPPSHIIKSSTLRSWSIAGVESTSGVGWLMMPARRYVSPAAPPHRLRDVTVWWGWPFLVLVVLPACWVAVRIAAILRRCDRVQRGLCPACGYDLRATPERCPECGAVPGNRCGVKKP